MTPDASAAGVRYAAALSFASQPGSLVAEKVSCPVVALYLGLAISSSSVTAVPFVWHDWQTPERTALGRQRAQRKSCTHRRAKKHV